MIPVHAGHYSEQARTAANTMRLEDWLAVFAADHPYGISPACEAHYRFAIRSLTRFLGRDPDTSDLVDSTISAWVDHLRATRSPHTARTQRAAILTLWNAAWREEMVALPPRRVRRLRTPVPCPTAWSPDQVERLVHAAGEKMGTVRGRKLRTGVHLVAFLRVSWDSGCRMGDVLRLRSCDFTTGGQMDLVQHKTGRRHVVRMWPETLAAIYDTLADEPRERLFPLATRWYQVHVRDLGMGLGLRGSVKWLRRSVATAAEATGGYGSRMLGHSESRSLAWYVDRGQLEPVMAPRLGQIVTLCPMDCGSD